MADTYEIGSIPPMSVWGDETVTFGVKRHMGHADWIMDVKPKPKGKITIDKTFGDFSYTPDPQDDEFTVTLQAGEGRLDKQTFSITVQPRLASDFHVIEHVSDEPNPTASSTSASQSRMPARPCSITRPTRLLRSKRNRSRLPE